MKRKTLPSSATMTIPSGFVFEEVFDKSELSATQRENLKNACFYILHCLSRHRYSQYHLDLLEEEGFYRLNAEILDDVCGNIYSQAIKGLLAGGVLVKDDRGYQVGVKSTGYRLSDAIEASDVAYKELNGTVRDRYFRYTSKLCLANEKRLLEIPHLTKWYDKSRLTAQLQAVHSFIEIAFSKINMLIDKSEKLTLVQKSEARGRAALRLNHQIAAINALVQGNYNLKKSARNERLNSVLTQMKRELRSFLQYDGKGLISLDIKASQPYLLNQLLKKTFYSRSSRDPFGWKSLTASNQRPASPNPPTTPNTTLPPLHSIMFPGVSQRSERQILAESRFFNFSWEEDLYLQLRDDLQDLGEEPMSRIDAKRFVMWLFFEHASYKYTHADFKRFEESYPLEAKVIRGFGNLQEKLLPVLLQRLESRLMLGKVTKAVSEELPTCPIFTIHDSIMTTPEYVGPVREIMKRVLQEVVGVEPGISVEEKTVESELAKIEAFATSVFDDIDSSIRKPKKGRGTKRKPQMVLPYSGYKRDVPLLLSLPRHGEMQVFSPIFHDLVYDGPEEDL